MKYPILAFCMILMYSCTITKQKSTQSSSRRGDSPRIITSVTETTYNLIFEPNSIKEEIQSNIEVVVKPLDVNDINDITFRASNFSGEYNIQKIDIYSYEERLKEENYLNSSNSDAKIYLNIIKELKVLKDKGEISGGVFNAFVEKMAFPKSGIDIYRPEIYFLDRGIDTYNPFKKGEKNFSVFQIDISNSSDENILFELKDFFISSGFEQLSPYDESFYNTLHKDNLDKLELSRRLNMPESLIVPKGSNVRRYLTTSPIDPSVNSLSVELIKEKITDSFKFEVTSSFKKKDLTYYGYTISCVDDFRYRYKKYLAILEDEEGNLRIIGDNGTKISEENIEDLFNLYVIGFNNYSFSFGTLNSFKFDDIKSMQVRVPFDEIKKIKKID